LILLHVNTDCMQIFLEEVASRHPDEKIIMVLDGTGRHASQTLQVPDNIQLLPLPAYAPELNPVEHLWDELREKFFNNLVFDSIDALEDHLEAAPRAQEHERDRVRSIFRWPWIINSLS
jgi:transposase